MGDKQRLDKILSNLGYGSRSEIKKLVKQGLITVNGAVAKKSDLQVDPEYDAITFDNQLVRYRKFIYIMMHKPAGVVSATEDSRDKTVLDLLDQEFSVFKPFPVGRLDKDTEGLLLLTNDGQLAHQLLSPKKQVPKVYFAEVAGQVTEADVEQFVRGVTLDDGYVTLPAELTIISTSFTQEKGWTSQIELTITEGKFHQVKRMFGAVAKKVTFLKRLSMGNLQLDPSLPRGGVRELTDEEIGALQLYVNQRNGTS